MFILIDEDLLHILNEYLCPTLIKIMPEFPLSSMLFWEKGGGVSVYVCAVVCVGGFGRLSRAAGKDSIKIHRHPIAV